MTFTCHTQSNQGNKDRRNGDAFAKHRPWLQAEGAG